MPDTIVVPDDRIVVLAAKGTARRVVRLRDVEIPDLWHIACALRKDRRYGPSAADAVLACWYLAHDLKRNLAGDIGPLPPGR
jgi:hypothetical protein